MRRAAVALLLAVTACSSTAQVRTDAPTGGDGLVAPSQDSGLGTTGSSLPVSTSGSGTTGGGSSSTSGGTSGGPSGSTGGSSTGAQGTGTTGGPPSVVTPGAVGRGVTAKTITIGFTYTANADAANSAIGAGAVTGGDDGKTAQGLVDEINATGGVAGRKVVLKKFAYDATSTAPAASQDQRACSAFTEDAQVLAVLGGNLTEVLLACLQKAGIPLLKAGVIVDDDRASLEKYRNLVLLAAFSQERALADLVASLTRQKWFSGWNALAGQPAAGKAKVGVLSYDPPQFQRAVKGTLLPRLRAAGYAPAASDVLFVHKPENQSDVSRTVAGLKSATLRLQQDGVTHLVFNDANGILMGLFATNAQSQSYFPRYGLTSGAGAQAIHDTGLVKSEQLNGLGGNSWLPTIDLPASDSSKYATSATKRCLDVLKRRTGATYSSTNAATIALGTCDSFFLFAQAGRAATSLTGAGLLQAIEGLGSGYVSPSVPGARLAPGKHDAASVAWDLRWDASCECVRYGPQHAVA